MSATNPVAHTGGTGVHQLGARQCAADEEDRQARAAILRLSEPGDGLLFLAVEVFGAAGLLRAAQRGRWTRPEAEQLDATIRERGLSVRPGMFGAALDRWKVRLEDADGVRDLRGMARLGARLVVPSDPEWPPGLADLGLEQPLGLWVRGEHRLDRALEPSVALVGARAASGYGAHNAGVLAYELCGHGVTVVSGGAYGIDIAAHRHALSAARHERGHPGTVAFMAGGVDRLYPRGNADVLEEIARRGLVVSETAPGMSPMRQRFLQRNRLIAAASQATVVVEAGWRSGALNTARRAAELARPVGALPGSVHAAGSAGCHRLIREGAAELVTSPDDVLQLLPGTGLDADPGHQDTLAAGAGDDLSDLEKRLFDALPVRGGSDISTLSNRAGLPVPEVMSALAALELRGLTVQAARGWRKNPS
ncbi:DNA-processing protein DprA [Sediminivirga luteola]|uniref:DNA processing protein DprA n=1 Tax=Sediminivirga luteola TaxID=1774748 RepID=A0A8J2XLV9_9MICO|nr:DNA-processing protein DprA [Sediminivirga luteola]MCI2264900.1 DNA-processing protein DprA [Sediminivirga luteola]GGA26402.1 DNA processing protein DprA [Sediminivirga luteola]